MPANRFPLPTLPSASALPVVLNEVFPPNLYTSLIILPKKHALVTKDLHKL